ncbi:MAG: acyl-ACP--UDP-N-acetylglucosamine O-acyltransferase [Bacteroidetes bacterium]|nr:acyl-ACP--UDP-N-acetylglucosamine O-acyltransferase [Bacteroidota bacterium]
MIHPSAIVDSGAHIEPEVIVGPYAVIEDDCCIGSMSEIKAHAVICRYTTLGMNCKVFSGAVIGSIPQDLKFNKEVTKTQIGDGSIIREYVTINRGTSAKGTTQIGRETMIMAYTHVAHDCIVGDHVILSNAVNMAGHVKIEDHVVIGGMVPIHQFVRIGSHAMVGGGFRVTQDVPPFSLAAGEPLRFCGLNTLGLKRLGFSQSRIHDIDGAYRVIYRSGKLRKEALEVLKADMSGHSDVAAIITFFESSKRGVISK